MNAKKVLFPTDFSTLSDAALSYASSVAAESGATLWIVHVEEPPLAYSAGDMYYGVLEPDTVALEKMLNEVQPTRPVPCEHRLLIGSPAEAIVQLAEEEDIDLIVLATHGRTGLKHLLMGSVAEQIVRRARCPVLTLKPASWAANSTKPVAAATG